MKKVIIANKKNLTDIKKRMQEEGADKIHVLADFDRTLTRAFGSKEKTPSLISELRKRGYISEEYSREANALAEKYHAIEVDLSISYEERKRAMHEWWTKHFALLIKHGLNKNHLEKIIDSGKIKFRAGALQFLDILHSAEIPLVVISSSGLGADSIIMFLQRYNRNYSNVHVISNEYQWDEEGNAVGVREPIIHCMNKDEAVLNDAVFYRGLRDELKRRINVLLLGDSLEDIGMIHGFDYENLIKIGFLNDEIETKLGKYEENFDVVITDDGSMSYVNKLLGKIVGK